MAPVLRPGDIFPPRPPETDRRRRPRWLLWIAAVVVLAMGAGVAIYLAGRKPASPSAVEVAAVRKAYLAWWGARKEAYLQLNPAPMRPYMTDAGYQQESAVLTQEQQANEPSDIEVPSHSMQIIVYSRAPYASVDDIWKSDNVTLDPTTHDPTSQPLGDLVEDSTTMKLVGARWLVDDRGNFGASSQDVSGTTISYAAVAGDQPEPSVRAELDHAFSSYNAVLRTAYLHLDPRLLTTVEVQPQLGVEQKHMSRQIAKNEPVRFVGEDNYRIGMEDSSHAWIYDTVLDESVSLNKSTGQPVEEAMPHVYRIRYSFVKGPHGWMVEDTGLN